jgi:hypothetical protein
MGKKIFLVGCIAFLFIGVAFQPIPAQTTPIEDIALQEATQIENLMDTIERIAFESTTYSEFTVNLQDLLLKNQTAKFPIVHELIVKILQFFLKRGETTESTSYILDLFERISGKLHPSYFVISYGAYHRLNPRKENSINRFKEGLSMWRYSEASKLLKGRTLIIERHPFEIHQKMKGPQVGFMRGFRGIYLDIESKLTGNAYVFFIGGAQKIRVFDLTPLSK